MRDNLVATVGLRMKEAREISGFTQSAAAKILGYRNSTFLCKIENNNAVTISMKVIIRASKLYDVSCDFLLGCSEDWERDARDAQSSNAMGYILETWTEQHLNDLNAIRRNENKVKTLCKAVGMYSQSVNECRKSLNLFMAKNKNFDDLKCGAMLVNAICGAENAVYNANAALKRYKADVDVEKNLRRKQLGVFD